MNASLENDGPSFETLSTPGFAELKVQRSRFIAEVHPASNELAARAVLADVTGRHHDARHHSFAWRLGVEADLVEFRSDAGEPSGSAGEPILNALRQGEVTDVVAVVARWFGGIKLGTGGLGRAYREAATLALEQATRRRVHLGSRFIVQFPYPLQKTVAHYLEALGGRRLDECYDDAVAWTVWVPAHRVAEFLAVILEVGQGRLIVTPDSG